MKVLAVETQLHSLVSVVQVMQGGAKGAIKLRSFPAFHHIKDDMDALELLLRRNIGGIFQLNHWLPVTLRALAESLFSNFGISDKLKVGSLPNPKIENSKVKFVKNELLNDTNFRDTYSGVSSYFESLLKDSQ